ncbi:VWA-like domain-containing protein [Clostridium polynesiense]|uniref:vWA domain-containing protein n=1 Tax=Clostridium polynesiense TaxID=1325933 RepID=UPI000693DC6D|nr:VWA-like domain-containing protein [Clostridium polynesiense]
MSFEEERIRLYGEAVKLEASAEITNKFKRELLALVEKCTLELMEKDEGFFGMFLMQLRREVSLKSQAPLSTVPGNEGYILYINPLTFLSNTKNEMKALLKHEVYHIMYKHHQRIKALRNKYSLLAINTAMDISVNQYINKLPAWSRKLYDTSLEYNIDLKENMPLEAYVEMIQRAIDKLTVKKDKSAKDNALDMESIHELWLQSDNITEDILNTLQKRLSLNAFQGKIPAGMEEALLLNKEKSVITWQDYLKNTIASMPSGYKKTITRKDRRQPDRLDIRGRLPKRIPKVIAAIDISASMSHKELHLILVELFNIIKNYQGEVRVIECDDSIKRIYNIRSIRDIKNTLENTGATAFSPVFQYIKENSLKDHFLIYFTDGKGEEKLTSLPVNYKTLWVLTGGQEVLSLKEYPGEIVKLGKENSSADKNDYGIKVAKELLKDWDIDTEANSIQSLRVDL